MRGLRKIRVGHYTPWPGIKRERGIDKIDRDGGSFI